MKDVNSMVGIRLKSSREALGLTQEGLAELIGVQPLQINRYEREKTEPSGEIVGRIATVLHVSADYLLGLTDDPTPSNLAGNTLNAKERAAISAWRRGQVVEAIKVIIGEA